MERAAYWVAFGTVIIAPPFLLIWLLIHPFTSFWRKLGPAPTYLAITPIIAAVFALLFHLRGLLLRTHFGFSLPLAIIAVLVFTASRFLALRWRRQLKISVLLGLPELSRDHPGKLLTEGIYAHLRHPRYVEITLGLAAMALFSNYLAAYLALLAYLPLLYLIVLLEERELRDRFGQAYEEYARRVPRFFPRLRKSPP